MTPGFGRLAVDKTGVRSVVRRALATSPLRLLFPGNRGSGAWIFTSTYGGGLVNRDALDLGLAVGAGATAFVSTQASTKVYPSPDGTRADLEAAIGPDAVLVVAPDPVVCFTGARYAQVQRFDLAAGASLACLDWCSCGRLARGERWAFDGYRNRLVVRRAGQLVCHDAVVLERDDGRLVERMGRFNVLATVLLVGPAFEAAAEAVVADLTAGPLVRRADLVASAAPLTGGGCLVRLAGPSVEAVGAVVRECLRTLPRVLGDDPWARKW